MPSFRRRTTLLVAAPLVIAAAAWLLHAPLLTAAARFLRVDDGLVRADAIYVLGGANTTRPAAAAELYRAGWAPRVLLPAVQSDTLVALGLVPRGEDVSAGLLRRAGVPPAAIGVLPRAGGSSSTLDDAVLLRGWARAHGARRVILVTSGYHSRRARWLFRRALAGTGVRVWMHPVPTPGVPEDAWWRTEDGLMIYVSEYLKLVHNFFYR